MNESVLKLTMGTVSAMAQHWHWPRAQHQQWLGNGSALALAKGIA